MTPTLSDRPRGPRWLNPVLWVLLPVAILVALEVVIRGTGLVKSSWSRVEQIARERKIDYLFVGTSRTWAAINEEAFEQEHAQLTGREVRAVRAGIGNSTNAQHVRGIRNVLAAVPRAFEGSVVFLESRAGIPGSERGADLRNQLGPGALEDVFRAQDLPALVTADIDAESKAATLVAWVAPPFRFLEHRGRFRRKLLERGEQALRRTGLFARSQRAPQLRLAEGSGIRTDAAGVEAVRELVGARLQQRLDAQAPIPWGRYDLLAIVDALHAAGARVTLLDMPLGTRDGMIWRSNVRRADAERLLPMLLQRGVGAMQVPLTFADSDFPDDLHLDLDGAERFSRALASECVRQEGGSAPSRGR